VQRLLALGDAVVVGELDGQLLELGSQPADRLLVRFEASSAAACCASADA
jgi:hypothetical protein